MALAPSFRPSLPDITEPDAWSFGVGPRASTGLAECPHRPPLSLLIRRSDVTVRSVVLFVPICLTPREYPDPWLESLFETNNAQYHRNSAALLLGRVRNLVKLTMKIHTFSRKQRGDGGEERRALFLLVITRDANYGSERSRQKSLRTRYPGFSYITENQ